MRLSTILTAGLLPLTAITSQIPIIQSKDNLSKIISESKFLSLHRDLCEIPSVSNYEHDIGVWLKKFLKAHHFKVITQKVPFKKGITDQKPRLNIYTYPDPSHYKSKAGKHKFTSLNRGNDDNDDDNSDQKHKKKKNKDHKKNKKHHDVPHPKVLLTSHIDTVPPHIPYSLHYNYTTTTFNRSHILIHGRGTVDDKACVATQITTALNFLLSSSSSSPLTNPTDIALLFVVDEESGGTGMKHFSNSSLYTTTNSRYQAILFGEPTQRKLVSGHKGIFMLNIDAQGIAAHSGYPWLGRSANSMILPVLNMLDRMQFLGPQEGGLPGSEKFGNTTINVGLMQGGVAANVVPEHASAEIAFRLAGGTVEENQEIVRKAITATDPEGLLEVEFGQGYGTVDLDVDVPGFESIAVNYGTDVPWLDVRDGVKKYLYGPGSIFVAHGANEGLTVGELEAGLEGYERLLTHALAL